MQIYDGDKRSQFLTKLLMSKSNLGGTGLKFIRWDLNLNGELNLNPVIPKKEDLARHYLGNWKSHGTQLICFAFVESRSFIN